jgi:hypothetical protein
MEFIFKNDQFSIFEKNLKLKSDSDFWDLDFLMPEDLVYSICQVEVICKTDSIFNQQSIDMEE